MIKFSKFTQGLPAAFIVLSAAIFTWGQDSSTKQNVRPDRGGSQTSTNAVVADDSTKYSYEFTQPKFFVKHIVLEHGPNGRGTISFERLNEDVPVVENIEISPAVLNRIKTYWVALDFLNSETNYQASQDFSHLGTMKIGMKQGDRKRVAEFNWTHNDKAEGLITEYKRIAEQAILVFDISIARENQPLNAPKLMEVMESFIKRNQLSDPKQLLPLLRDMTTDEHIPLMARNHAQRIIKLIEK